MLQDPVLKNGKYEQLIQSADMISSWLTHCLDIQYITNKNVSK
jgi:hypothetical protein